MNSSVPSSSLYLGANPAPQAFAKYAKKREIFLHPDVAFLVPTKTMGMGVFAARPLPAGTVVISCPESAAVSPYMKEVPTSPCVAALHTSRVAMEDAVLFDVLTLMAELSRSHSPWRPWLEVCPRMVHHFFDLTARQAAALGFDGVSCEEQETLGAHEDGSDPTTDFSHRRRLTMNAATLTGLSQALHDLHVGRRWGNAQLIMADFPDLWPSPHASFGLFCECLAQVFSRNFHREELPGREGPYLLPGLDILNHSFSANTSFEVRGGGRKHPTAFTVVTTRALQKGEQVYGCYGRIGAARFAVEFQFVTKAVLRNDLVRFSAASLATVAAMLHCQRRTDVPPKVAGANADVPSLSKFSDGDAESAKVSAAPKTEPRGGGGDNCSEEEEDAVQKESERRVERLQRLGLLYDEGLYLVRPYATWEAEEAVEAAPSFRWSTPADHSREISQHRRMLAAAAYLLMAPKGLFEDLYHRISVEWSPPETKEVACTVRAFLQVKIDAAQAQLEAAASLFGDSARDVMRCDLIQSVLTSELATLRYYAGLYE